MIRRAGRRAVGLVVGAALVVGSLLSVPWTASAATAVIDRLSGDDRYATSARISAATFSPGVAVAYVASGTAFPDALSGAAAAGTRASPVLLIGSDAVPAVIAAELVRLRPGEIVVLGGEHVVSATAFAALSEFTTGPVTRIGRADRFETSAAISAETFGPGAPVAFLASGANFPDALSAASVAGGQRGPILLTQQGMLPDSVRDELARLRPARLVVVGGPAAVSDAVATAASAASGVVADRLWGPDRYSTSAAISADAFAPGVPVVYLAHGLDFPDALSGAAAARGAPVLLTAATAIPAVIAQEIIRLRPGRIVILGGPAAVSTTVEQLLSIVGTDLPAATAGSVTRTTEVPAGSCLGSPDQSHRLCVGLDGAFGIYRAAGTALWRSGTSDGDVRSLRIRPDGDTVLYSVDGRIIWESSTSGTAATTLDVQNDGDLMLRSGTGAIVWSSMSSASAPRWSLPFAAGQRWSSGAPHANTGNTPGARGSLDFGPVAGADRRVLAIADGTVYRIQCGAASYLGINHANGWQSTYYHLVNYQNQLVGQFVPAGTYLGDVGRTVPCGGGSTFDHVHLTIRRAGAPVSVEGMRFDGYTVRSSGRDYWGFWTDAAGQRVLTASGGAACCLTAQ